MLQLFYNTLAVVSNTFFGEAFSAEALAAPMSLAMLSLVHKSADAARKRTRRAVSLRAVGPIEARYAKPFAWRCKRRRWV